LALERIVCCRFSNCEMRGNSHYLAFSFIWRGKVAFLFSFSDINRGNLKSHLGSQPPLRGAIPPPFL
jgi:hypothetical protein